MRQIFGHKVQKYIFLLAWIVNEVIVDKALYISKNKYSYKSVCMNYMIKPTYSGLTVI